jgi:type II secretion system protein I
MSMPRSHGIRSAARLPKPSGFTLLEVLIALCIILIALTPLIQLHVTSIRLIDSGSHRARAASLANAKLAEIVAEESPELGTANGRIEEDRGLTFFWKSTAMAADPPELAAAALLGMRHVHVDVTWQDGRQDAMVSVDTFVHIPTQNVRTEPNDRYELDREKTTGRSRR